MALRSPCSNLIEKHPRRGEIEYDITIGLSARAIARRYDICKDTVLRWKQLKATHHSKSSIVDRTIKMVSPFGVTNLLCPFGPIREPPRMAVSLPRLKFLEKTDE